MPNLHRRIHSEEDGAERMLPDLPEGNRTTAEDSEATEVSTQDADAMAKGGSN